MDTFIALGQGMLVAMQPHNLLFALIGVLLGTAVGVLPGIGPALTVALLCSGGAATAFLAPVAFHRRYFRSGRKEALVWVEGWKALV